ncbi:MAG: DegT/DnrJ/EryC1/StrS family aminotransferase [Ignavibacteria bacterium]|nr:DegT/DnrJ/EryC1/StrS family aminotransferase [Ignavibacteria bacterium]
MVDLVTQYQSIKKEIDETVLHVLESGQYILGKAVEDFEKACASYLGVKHAIGCASGTDALQVGLMALGIKPGDEIVTTSFTFVATTETIVLLGGVPVYVDIDPKTFNIDPARIESAITKRTKAILPVHLYGHPCDMDPIRELSQKYGIPIVEDAAQAMGAEYKGKMVGGIGAVGAISFFPSKNLGAYGDGGMVVTNDDRLAELIRMITIHGSRIRYRHEILGVNSRLDALQAAILSVKLKYLDMWNKARRSSAEIYTRLLSGRDVVTPSEDEYAHHIFHQYTVRLKHRDAVARVLASKSIPHAIYYPIPLHLQEAFKSVGKPKGSLPITEQATEEVLSLPMHSELAEDQQRSVVDHLLRAVEQSKSVS